MNKLFVHRIIIAALILLNAFLVFQFIKLSKPYPHSFSDKESPKYIIIEKLNFDKQQVVIYESLIEQHRENIKSLNMQMMSTEKDLLKVISVEDNVKNDSLFIEIGKLQSMIEKVHFQHFLDIKSICKADQLKDFEELEKRLVELFDKRKGPKRLTNKRKGKR